ncbi:hypothetical protein Hbl1158_14205 [Halobaculum sp. CBA1158]|uniref:DUF7119 family protein n=1 Tax=Halobaculum sp. CBA1158 TaxID=2904243 RepID=UPI001F189997|nr:hypothetical protein [Halobaculum sp. CBA1158]UIO99660.1 hypothetical protein Hbl1158_14205 [Halobaculum sp. CBA1158]
MSDERPDGGDRGGRAGDDDRDDRRGRGDRSDRGGRRGDVDHRDGDSGLRPADRRAEVGEPVVRGDPAVAGERAERAARFDPDDDESLAEAAETVRQFAGDAVGGDDNVVMLRGAAACAALVRGHGSYKAAAEAAGDGVQVSFIRKWARVHDLPESVRRHVARGDIAPTAAKHVARVAGDARFRVAWAILDADLTVREVRRIASAINDGTDPEIALREEGVTPGRLRVDLPPAVYRRLRDRASLENREPGDVIADALETYR